MSSLIKAIIILAGTSLVLWLADALGSFIPNTPLDDALRCVGLYCFVVAIFIVLKGDF